MTRLTTHQIEGWIEHWTDETAEALNDTVNRLRYCFPEVAESDLRRMAERHPTAGRTWRYCKRRVASYRRMLRRAVG